MDSIGTFQLGDRCRDRATGIDATVTGRADSLGGVPMALLERQDQNGLPIRMWVEYSRLELVGAPYDVNAEALAVLGRSPDEHRSLRLT